MNSTLIIACHPNMTQSVVNQRWLVALSAHPECYTVHDLYAAYPDGNIDVAHEQALVEAHGTLIFMFPIYWFSCPPLLKTWLDKVLTHGWAFGSSASAFKGRKVGLVVSHGTPTHDYQYDGKVRHTLTETLIPFENIANYIGATFLPIFSFHALEFFSEEEKRNNWHKMATQAEQSAQQLLMHLQRVR